MGNSGIIARYSHYIGYGMRSTEHRPPIDVQKPVKVFDLFCGCGGTSCGLNAAGMDIRPWSGQRPRRRADIQG